LDGIRGRWLATPPHGWEALCAADPDATPAHQPALAAAFAATQSGTVAQFLALERNGELRGGMPIVVQRRAGFHWLLAMPSSLPGSPLAFDRAEREEIDLAAAIALDALAAELGSVGGLWVCYRPAGPPVLDAALRIVSGETRRFEAAHMPLGGGLEPLLQRMDRKTRKEIRQAREQGLRVVEAPGELETVYALYRAQSRSWRNHRALPLELLRRILLPRTGGSGAPLARLFVASDRRGVLAGVLALDSPCETLPWWSGTHPDARLAHAFPLLLWSLIEWAHAHGRVRVNLGASADRGAVLAFKESMGAVAFQYPVRWLDARYAPLAGRAVAALQERVRRSRPRGEPT
jgi:hypothetical protein